MKHLKIPGVLIYLFALVLVILLYVMYLFTPLNEQIAAMDAQHVQDSARLAEYESSLSGIGALREKVATLERKLALAAENEPMEALAIPDDLQKAVAASGGAFSSVSVSEPVQDASRAVSSAGKALYNVAVSVSFNGNKAQMLAFLDYFETKSQGAYYVTQFSYSGGDVAELSLGLTLYCFGPPVAKP